jgi:peptide/nickel transport system substrate-binding protein
LAQKIRFKLEIFAYHAKKMIPFFLVGITVGIFVFLYQKQLISLYQSPILHPQKIGVAGLYTSQNLPVTILRQISFGLTQIDQNQKPILSPLVKSFQTPDEKTYIFELNQNIFWHNKLKLTANTIKPQIDGLTSESLSPTTLKIVTDKPFAPLLTVLSQPLFRNQLVGLGPYHPDQIKYQDGFVKTLTISPEDKLTLPKIIYRFYQNENDLITGYKLGEVDKIETETLPNYLNDWSQTKIVPHVNTTDKYLGIFINTQKFSQKQLRQALAYATPKTPDKNKRCLGPISPNSWAYNSDVKDYAYNPQRAKDLFEGNKIEKINLSVINRDLLPIAEEIKNSWKKDLGIDVTITIENQIDSQNFDAVLAYSGIPADPDQYTFWHSTQEKTNITHLNNSRIDKLLEEGRLTFNLQDRKKIYLDFQRFLLEESPVIFISYPTTYSVSRIK